MHIFQLARHLAALLPVKLYALSNHPGNIDWGPLAEVCEELRAFERSPDRRINLNPPAVRSEYSASLVSHLSKIWAQQPAGLVQLETTSMARYASLARQSGARTVCTAHIVGFVNQIRRARLEHNKFLGLRRIVGAFSFWQFELRALRFCQLLITFNEVDQAALRRWHPRTPVIVLPSGIDLEVWQPNYNANIEDTMLFVGNFQHPPNSEGALWLTHMVWPLVLRERPQARLILAGRSPTPEIQALAGPSIHVPGTLDNLRPLYGQASVFVAPIFWGSGIRIKLLEALASGIPIVSTSLAAEGLDLSRSAMMAETAPEFAAAILRLLNDRQLRERLGKAGPLVVQQNHDWKRLAQRLVELYGIG